MLTKLVLILSLLALLLVGCTSAALSPTPGSILTNTPPLEFNSPTQVLIPITDPNQSQGINGVGTSPISDPQAVMDMSFKVVEALKDQDTTTLSEFVHPQLGLRFSPYSYVKDTDQVFTAESVAGLMEDGTIYLWGNYDGSGEPINLTFADYYAKFVYDVDFANPAEMSLNHRLGSGNSLDNAQEFYPGAMIVEFHFPGFDPQYGGMDWRSLRLVFMQSDQTWYLAGIIHDQWTI